MSEVVWTANLCSIEDGLRDTSRAVLRIHYRMALHSTGDGPVFVIAVPSSVFHTGLMHPSWTRILRLGQHSWLGLVGDVLYIGDETRPKRQLDLEIPIGLLPCLERPYEEVRAELGACERELSMLSGPLLSAVPLAAIPRTAVATQMDYWTSLSVPWLASLPASEVDDNVIIAIEEASWAGQASRHAARRLRRSRSRTWTRLPDDPS